MIVIGHSHVGAIHSAARSLGVELHLIQMKTRSKASLVEAQTLHPDFLKEIQSYIEKDQSKFIFSFIGGALHTGLGLLQHPQPFDFILPDRPDIPLNQNATILPYDAIKFTMARRLKFDLFVLSELRRRLNLPVIHFSSPPPVDNEAFILDTIRERLKEELGKQGVSPAPLRLKLWRVESEIMRERCDVEGIQFVPPPPEALDGDYLADAYRKDPSHGNEAYGVLLVKQMRGFHQ